MRDAAGQPAPSRGNHRDMKIALFGINNGPCAFPATATAVARAAESAGFESLWTGEHVILPDPQVPPSPVAPGFPMLDPAISIAFLAAHTKTIRLGTGIIILPQRNPVVLAKQLASADVLSGGRLIFGIGIGYLKPEFEAIGAPFDHKGPRAEEYLAAMIALWSMDKPRFEGKWVRFSGVDARPRPVQKPHPEIVFGGHTAEAYSRAVRLARGWYGFALDVDGAAKCIEGVRSACAKANRKFEDIEISVTPRGAVDRDSAKRFADLGVSRLILLQRANDESGILKQISDTERELIGKV
jgi:probable F420-dependent oxidoreductase